MKLLVLADLHFQSKTLANKFYLEKQKRVIRQHLGSAIDECDLVVIAGDVTESSIIKTSCNPLDALYYIFDKEVIFTLGNHEFSFNKHSDVLTYWEQFFHHKVHCLDICGKVTFNDVNFVGNVLWYDFSLNKCMSIMKGEVIDGWLDATIKDFDPIKECELCKDQIFSSLSKEHKNVLLTHMVPHIDLNIFSRTQPYSPYNAYSGCERFLLDIIDAGYKIDYAICGHTHQRECKTIEGINCINVGNDYFQRTNKIKYMIIEV